MPVTGAGAFFAFAVRANYNVAGEPALTVTVFDDGL
jgi:hypothetical protein